MQAIFGFGGDDLAKWDENICTYFPLAGELATPWRWINAGAEPLGRWLLDVRGKLLRGEFIDLRTAPAGVSWVELDGTEDHQRRLRAARVRPPNGQGCVLIIGDSTNPDGQRQFASQTPGAITVEAVDLRDLVAFARALDLGAPDALERLAGFAQTVMRNVGAVDLVRRVLSLMHGTARKPSTDAEAVAILFAPHPVSPRCGRCAGRNRQASGRQRAPARGPAGRASRHFSFAMERRGCRSTTPLFGCASRTGWWAGPCRGAPSVARCC